MKVYWFEQELGDVPAHDEWLSAIEAAYLATLRVPKRRNDWRLGRWTAKRVISACLARPVVELAAIEIRPAASGAPEVFTANKQAELSVSLSHREGRALCAVILSGGALGCDLEFIEPRTDAFVADYFTAAEQALLRVQPQRRFELAALLWSAKESALKALKLGLRADTRSVAVTPSLAGPTNDWSPLRVKIKSAESLRGYWRRSGNFVETVVAAPRADVPIVLPGATASLPKVREVTAKKSAAA